MPPRRPGSPSRWAGSSSPGARLVTTYAGRSWLATGLTVAAGLTLVLAGLLACYTSRPGPAGDLALLAGLVWFAPVWVGWEFGPTLVRSLAMLVAGFVFALLFHLVLAFPGDPPPSAGIRALVWAVYLEAALAALGLALFRDPHRDPTCWANCTRQRVSPPLTAGPGANHEATDRWFTASAAAVTAGGGVRLAAADEEGPGPCGLLPVALPAMVFAGAGIAHAITLHWVPFEDPGTPALLLLFEVQAAAVILIAVGLARDAVTALAHRRSVARIVANLGETPAPGFLESALARALGDPELRIAYWLSAAQRFVDAQGRPVAEPAAMPGRLVTTLASAGHGGCGG